MERGYIEDGNCVLAADGLMLEKEVLRNKVGPDHTCLLTEFRDLIREKIGFDLIFTEKAIDKR